MNERIRELAEQAGMTDDKFGMYFAKDKHDEDGVDLEKFAKLIIEKCSRFVGDPNSVAVKKMKEHFGVDQDSEEDSNNETCPRCGEEWSGTSCGLPECGWVVGVEE